MNYQRALLAGALLGLAGLPLSGWEIPGFLWPLPFLFMTKSWNFSFKSATVGGLIFIGARYLIQNIWLGQAVYYYLPSFFKTLLVYLSANLIISLPFAFYCGIWFWSGRFLSGRLPLLNKHWRSIFVLSFPLVNYLIFKLNEVSLFPGLPGGKLAEKIFFLNNFSDVYSYLGADGFEFVILQSLVILTLSIFSVYRFRLLLLLFPWFAITLFQVNKTTVAQADDAKATLNLLMVPWSDTLNDNASREAALQNLLSRSKVANHPQVDLIIWGESALPGLAESGRDMERLQKELLLPSQALIFGGNRREFGNGGFKNFNAAFMLSGDQFEYDIYKKESLAPFTEYIPFWARYLGLKTLSPQKYIFTPGKTKLFRFKNYLIGAGVCYDQYFNNWYLKRESEADLYIFINREYPFQNLGKKILRDSSLARALQTKKPVARLTNGGFSGLMGEHTDKAYGKWDSASQTALYQVKPGGRTSVFYKWGYYWLPFILFGHTCFTILAYIKIHGKHESI